MQDPIDRFIEDLRHEADTSDFSHLTDDAVARATRPSPLRRLRTRAAAVAASFTVAFGALGGVAYAANGAAPGDALYGIDRALEAVGIGNGGASERLAEIEALMESGDIGHGLQHAADTVVGEGEARTALLDAANRIGDTPAPEGVPPLLTYLAENIDSVDGRIVAELATQIGGPPEGTPAGPPEGNGPPEGTPNGPPDGTPGEPPEGTPNGPPAGAPGPGVTPPTTTP